MGDISDFKRGQIVGARLAGASVSQTAKLCDVSRATVSRVMCAYAKEGRTTSRRSNCRGKRKVSERDIRTLTRIVARNRKTTATAITAEFNTHLREPVCTKTVRRYLHEANIHGRVAIPKPFISCTNARKRVQWCQKHKTWTLDDLKRVIFSDESSYSVFQTTGRVFVWRSPSDAYNPDCLVPTVKHGGGSVMVWGAISWQTLGPLVVLEGRVTSKDYRAILEDHLHPMVQTLFPNGGAVFQDDNCPIHTAKCVTEWFDEHDSEIEHLPWPAQSPDLNIIEPVWGLLEARVRKRFPPPRTRAELVTVLQEEWLQIPLQEVQDLYHSFPCRVAAVLAAKGAPTPY